MANLEGARVTVMGLGRFGGGVGVARFLAAQGAQVLVTDVAPADELAESVGALGRLVDQGRLTLRLGGHNVSDFTDTDLVVANPAVPRPWDNRFIRAAEAAGVPVTTEISLLVERLTRQDRVIAVTGSAGKSTTTAMIAHGLRAFGVPVLMGGNIGGSLLNSIGGADSESWVVLELSSAMLYWLDRVSRSLFSPQIAVVTNLLTNHIDWHGDEEHYRACKQFLMGFQPENGPSVLGPTMAAWARFARGRCRVVDPGEFRHELALPGEHNRVNAAMACAACEEALGRESRPIVERAMSTFAGLPHRLQRVETPDGRSGRQYFNDSKSTTPEATIRAISALEGLPGLSRRAIHLIVGGYDKGSDLVSLAELCGDLGGLYTIGATGPSIASRCAGAAVECGTLADAFEAAAKRMGERDVLLLSPGCASWDQYDNYEQRGDEFIRLVASAVAAGATPTTTALRSST